MLYLCNFKMSGQFCDFCVLGIEIYVFIFVVIVQWCNGSTPDFGSVSPGSSPGWTTQRSRTEKSVRDFFIPVGFAVHNSPNHKPSSK